MKNTLLIAALVVPAPPADTRQTRPVPESIRAEGVPPIPASLAAA